MPWYSVNRGSMVPQGLEVKEFSVLRMASSGRTRNFPFFEKLSRCIIYQTRSSYFQAFMSSIPQSLPGQKSLAEHDPDLFDLIEKVRSYP
jgi:hypothetical protein